MEVFDSVQLQSLKRKTIATTDNISQLIQLISDEDETIKLLKKGLRIG